MTIKYVKHLVSLVLCISFLFFSFNLSCYAIDDTSFNSSDLDCTLFVYNSDDTFTDLSDDILIHSSSFFYGRDCTQFVFPGSNTGVSKYILMSNLSNLNSTHEYNIKFSFCPVLGSRVADFNLNLNFYDPYGSLIHTQSLLYLQGLTGSSVWSDFDFNFVPDSLVGQPYTCKLEFEFNLNSSVTNAIYFSPTIDLIDIDDTTPYYNSVLTFLSDIFVGIVGGTDSKGVEHIGIVDSVSSNLLELNTNFGDFLNDFLDFNNNFNGWFSDFELLTNSLNDWFSNILNFTNSFNTNISDILDLSFSNFFSDLFNNINISLISIGNSINNNNTNIGDSLDRIESEIKNCKSVLNDIKIELSNLSFLSSISQQLDTLNTSIVNGFNDMGGKLDGMKTVLDDVKSGIDDVKSDVGDILHGPGRTEGDLDNSNADDFNHISDDIESADGDLPGLSSDDIDSIVDTGILSQLNLGFIAINNIFDEVVTALGFSSVIVFCLSFGLAIYLIGRRLGG